MNIEKVTLSAVCKPRKMDFIKYTNDKSYMNNKNLVIEDCFNKSHKRECSLIALNFIA